METPFLHSKLGKLRRKVEHKLISLTTKFEGFTLTKHKITQKKNLWEFLQHTNWGHNLRDTGYITFKYNTQYCSEQSKRLLKRQTPS